MLTLPVYVYLPAVYAAEFGLPLASIGLVLLAVRLFDAASDPIIGYCSDRLPIRGERRRPYLILSIPLIGIAAWMVMRPPTDVGLGYLALWSALLSIGWTLAIIPYNAWGAELSGDYNERSRITGTREALVVAGTVIATALPAGLAAAGVTGNAAVLSTIAIIVCVSLPILAVIAVLAVPEPVNYSRTVTGFRAGLAIMRSNRPFLRLIAAFGLNGIANGLPASLFLFFAAERLAASQTEQGLLLLTYFFCGVAAIPFWVWLSRHWGKHRTWCVAMLAACGAFVWVPLLDAGDIVPFLAICVVTGAALGADLTLPTSMQADVIDADTAKSGEQRSAIYFAMWSMVTKLTLALAVGVALPTLALFGFEPGSGTATGLLALAVLYSLVPTGFKLAAIALMWRYPLTETAQAELRHRIEA